MNRPACSRRRRAAWTAAAAIGLLTAACRMDSPPDKGAPPDKGTPPGESTPPAAAAEQVQIGDVQWYVDYEAAVEIAREQDKALWVHFGENPG